MTGVAPLARVPELIGREAELATLADTLTEATDGPVRIVLVEGEPGIGKTRLVAEAIDAVGPSFQVHRGHAHELARDRPFGVVADALDLDAPGDPERAHIDSLLRSDQTGGSAQSDFAEMRFQIVEAILAMLGTWATQRPLLIALEDLHWADTSSLLVVDQLAKRHTELPVGVVSTLRPSPRSAMFEQLRRGLSSDVMLHMSLSPLDSEAVDGLVAAQAGASPGPELQRLVGGAAGNPFYITELVSALGEQGSLFVQDDRVEVAAGVDPESLRTTILRRLEYLTPRCLDTLRVAAVLGSRWGLDDLSVVLGVQASELVSVLDEAIRSGLIVESGRDFVFRHHLVWNAIYQDLPLAAREAVHVQIARRLADVERPAAQVATHFIAGAAPGDRQALQWLQQAAGEAMSRAPDVAADLLRGALQLVGDAEDVRDRLSIDLAQALTWAGRLDDAEAILADLVGGPHGPRDDARLRLGLARILIIRGRPGAAMQHYDRVMTSPTLDGWERALALADQATAALLSGDVAGAEQAARAALEEGRAVGHDPAVCGALCAAGWVANLRGRTGEALEIAEQAVAVANDSPARETGRRYPYVFLGLMLMDSDRLVEGRRAFEVSRRSVEAFGDAWQLPIPYLGAALADFYAGAYDDALASLITAHEIIEEVGTRTLVVWSAAIGVHIAIDQDEFTEASRLLHMAEQQAAEDGPGMGYDWMLWARARLLEAEGKVADAASLLRNAWDLAESLGLVAQRRLIGPDLVRLLVAVGDREQARAAADAMDVAADLGGVPSVRAAAERCRGLAEQDADRLMAAVERARACPQRMEHARTCEDAGRVLAASGREDEARAAFEEAAELYHAGGARRGEHRVDAALRKLGVARGRREERSRPATGWEALTPTELEVSGLVTEGLTNLEVGRRLFISPRTVETHLTHIYGKLGVSSRVELAAAAASR